MSSSVVPPTVGGSSIRPSAAASPEVTAPPPKSPSEGSNASDESVDMLVRDLQEKRPDYNMDASLNASPSPMRGLTSASVNRRMLQRHLSKSRLRGSGVFNNNSMARTENGSYIGLMNTGRSQLNLIGGGAASSSFNAATNGNAGALVLFNDGDDPNNPTGIDLLAAMELDRLETTKQQAAQAAIGEKIAGELKNQRELAAKREAEALRQQREREKLLAELALVNEQLGKAVPIINGSSGNGDVNVSLSSVNPRHHLGNTDEGVFRSEIIGAAAVPPPAAAPTASSAQPQPTIVYLPAPKPEMVSSFTNTSPPPARAEETLTINTATTTTAAEEGKPPKAPAAQGSPKAPSSPVRGAVAAKAAAGSLPPTNNNSAATSRNASPIPINPTRKGLLGATATTAAGKKVPVPTTGNADGANGTSRPSGVPAKAVRIVYYDEDGNVVATRSTIGGPLQPPPTAAVAEDNDEKANVNSPHEPSGSMVKPCSIELNDDYARPSMAGWAAYGIEELDAMDEHETNDAAKDEDAPLLSHNSSAAVAAKKGTPAGASSPKTTKPAAKVGKALALAGLTRTASGTLVSSRPSSLAASSRVASAASLKGSPLASRTASKSAMGGGGPSSPTNAAAGKKAPASPLLVKKASTVSSSSAANSPKAGLPPAGPAANSTANTNSAVLPPTLLPMNVSTNEDMLAASAASLVLDSEDEHKLRPDRAHRDILGGGGVTSPNRMPPPTAGGAGAHRRTVTDVDEAMWKGGNASTSVANVAATLDFNDADNGKDPTQRSVRQQIGQPVAVGAIGAVETLDASPVCARPYMMMGGANRNTHHHADPNSNNMPISNNDMSIVSVDRSSGLGNTAMLMNASLHGVGGDSARPSQRPQTVHLGGEDHPNNSSVAPSDGYYSPSFGGVGIDGGAATGSASPLYRGGSYYGSIEASPIRFEGYIEHQKGEIIYRDRDGKVVHATTTTATAGTNTTGSGTPPAPGAASAGTATPASPNNLLANTGEASATTVLTRPSGTTVLTNKGLYLIGAETQTDAKVVVTTSADSPAGSTVQLAVSSSGTNVTSTAADGGLNGALRTPSGRAVPTSSFTAVGGAAKVVATASVGTAMDPSITPPTYAASVPSPPTAALSRPATAAIMCDASTGTEANVIIVSVEKSPMRLRADHPNGLLEDDVVGDDADEDGGVAGAKRFLELSPDAPERPTLAVDGSKSPPHRARSNMMATEMISHFAQTDFTGPLPPPSSAAPSGVQHQQQAGTAADIFNNLLAARDHRLGLMGSGGTNGGNDNDDTLSECGVVGGAPHKFDNYTTAGGKNGNHHFSAAIPTDLDTPNGNKTSLHRTASGSSVGGGGGVGRGGRLGGISGGSGGAAVRGSEIGGITALSDMPFLSHYAPHDDVDDWQAAVAAAAAIPSTVPSAPATANLTTATNTTGMRSAPSVPNTAHPTPDAANADNQQQANTDAGEAAAGSSSGGANPTSPSYLNTNPNRPESLMPSQAGSPNPVRGRSTRSAVVSFRAGGDDIMYSDEDKDDGNDDDAVSNDSRGNVGGISPTVPSLPLNTADINGNAVLLRADGSPTKATKQSVATARFEPSTGRPGGEAHNAPTSDFEDSVNSKKTSNSSYVGGAPGDANAAASPTTASSQQYQQDAEIEAMAHRASEFLPHTDPDTIKTTAKDTSHLDRNQLVGLLATIRAQLQSSQAEELIQKGRADNFNQKLTQSAAELNNMSQLLEQSQSRSAQLAKMVNNLQEQLVATRLKGNAAAAQQQQPTMIVGMPPPQGMMMMPNAQQPNVVYTYGMPPPNQQQYYAQGGMPLPPQQQQPAQPSQQGTPSTTRSVSPQAAAPTGTTGAARKPAGVSTVGKTIAKAPTTTTGVRSSVGARMGTSTATTAACAPLSSAASTTSTTAKRPTTVSSGVKQPPTPASRTLATPSTSVAVGASRLNNTTTSTSGRLGATASSMSLSASAAGFKGGSTAGSPTMASPSPNRAGGGGLNGTINSSSSSVYGSPLKAGSTTRNGAVPVAPAKLSVLKSAAANNKVLASMRK